MFFLLRISVGLEFDVPVFGEGGRRPIHCVCDFHRSRRWRTWCHRCWPLDARRRRKFQYDRKCDRPRVRAWSFQQVQQIVDSSLPTADGKRDLWLQRTVDKVRTLLFRGISRTITLKDRLLKSLSIAYEDINVESASTRRKSILLHYIGVMTWIQYVCFAGEYLINEIRLARETVPDLTQHWCYVTLCLKGYVCEQCIGNYYISFASPKRRKTICVVTWYWHRMYRNMYANNTVI